MKCIICNKGTTRKDYCGSCNKVVRDMNPSGETLIEKMIEPVEKMRQLWLRYEIALKKEPSTDQVCDCGKYKHEKARYCSSCAQTVARIVF